jgi:hypothetical protein
MRLSYTTTFHLQIVLALDSRCGIGKADHVGNLLFCEERQRRPAKVRASIGPVPSFLPTLYQSQRRIFSALRHFSISHPASSSSSTISHRTR